MNIKTIAAGFMGLLASVATFGHSYLPPTAGQSVTIIPDIGVSRAAYRTLSTSGQVDIYEFAAKKDQEIYIQMTVPVLDRQKGFSPSFVLIYTGGEDVGFESPLVEKGILVDPRHEVVDQVVEHDDAAEPNLLGVAYDSSRDLVFDEPVTGTKYWTRQTLTVKAPADGTYRLGVYARDGQTGKYVLAPGQREQFGLGDILTLPSVRISVRQFCEQPVWGDYVVWGLLGAAALAAAGYGIYALILL
jgi:hypothetical protein